MAELDARRAEVLGNAARVIQRQFRTWIARKKFRSIRNAAIVLQSFIQGIFLRISILNAVIISPLGCSLRTIELSHCLLLLLISIGGGGW